LYHSITLARKYLHHYIHAANSKGHGIHSPFVFAFIKEILNDKKTYPAYQEIEILRKALLQNESTIIVEDFGAGSAIIPTNERVVSKMAASSLKPRKYAQLLFRMVEYFQPNTIIELGTSFGISTGYMAKGKPDATVYTLEGSKAIAAIAQQQFKKLQIHNIQTVIGAFDDTLPTVLQKCTTIDFVFIDGNHRKDPTIAYFLAFLEKRTNDTMIIFDDIHWSAGMEEAWAFIVAHPAVTLSIDLFFIGIVWVNPSFLVKQHFSVRF
jgi:predicted O-methyltransferase YrrM